MEVWKPVKEYNYEVSSLGRVRNTSNNKILSLFDKNRMGYYRVILFKDGQRKRHFVHRLVAETFLENIENKPQVNHKDGNKQNNNVENLEWVSQSENMKHSYYVLKNKTGFAYGFGGSEEPWNKGRTDLKTIRPEIYKKAWETRRKKQRG